VTDVFWVLTVSQQVSTRRQIHYLSPFMLPGCAGKAKLSQLLSGTAPQNETFIALAAAIINGQKKTPGWTRNLRRFKAHGRKGNALRLQHVWWLDRLRYTGGFENLLCQRSGDEMRRGYHRCCDEHDQ